MIIVSTSGQEMVAPIGALLGASSVIATRMEVADGHYTGQVEFYAYGEAKAEQVRALAAERGYSLPLCYAYSDSVTDLPMLEIVGHPRAVNPDRALRKIAQQRGWPVLTFSAHRAAPAAAPPAACEPGNQSRSPIGNARLYASGRSVVERCTDQSVRAWRPGTHARPAAGGEPRHGLPGGRVRQTGTHTGWTAGMCRCTLGNPA